MFETLRNKPVGLIIAKHCEYGPCDSGWHFEFLDSGPIGIRVRRVQTKTQKPSVSVFIPWHSVYSLWPLPKPQTT